VITNVKIDNLILIFYALIGIVKSLDLALVPIFVILKMLFSFFLF